MNSVIQYVLQKASKITNADALCCNFWKFVTQEKRRSEHAGVGLKKFFPIGKIFHYKDPQGIKKIP